MAGYLQNYLERKKLEGRLDSEGSFTVDRAKMLEKDARYAVGNPLDALLKLLQLFHHPSHKAYQMKWGVDTIEISVTRVENVSPRSLLSERATLDPLAGKLLERFGMLQIIEPGGSVVYDKNGRSLNSEVDLGPNLVRLRVWYQVQGAFWQRPFLLARQRNSDRSYLRERLAFSQYAPVLPGHGSWWPRPHLAQEPEFIVSIKGGYEARHDHLHALDPELGKTYVKAHSYADRFANPIYFGYPAWKEKPLLLAPVLARFFVFPASAAQPKLTLVKSGVVVGEVDFPVTGVACANIVDTDASGLQFVRNQKLERLLEYLQNTFQTVMAGRPENFLSKFQ